MSIEIPADVVQASAFAVREVVNFGDDRGCWCEECTEAATEVARAALSAALPLLALDRDTIAKTLGTHRVERQAFAPSPEFYCHDCDENSPGTPEDHLADAVIAASPLRSVTEVREQIAAEMDALAQREREAVEYERSYGGRGGRLGMHASRIGAFEDAARIALTAKRVSVGSRNGGAS